MYGRTMGTLNVYSSQNVSANTLLWTLSGNQGNRWNSAQLSITSTQSYNVSNDNVNGVKKYMYTLLIDYMYNFFLDIK